MSTDNDPKELRFGFGKNWKNFIEKGFSQGKVDVSKRHLLGFLGVDDLQGQSFLDIGCGSGLHSLAAYQAGAERVSSFDYDIDSVRTTEYLRTEKAGAPDNWTVQQGSVLDADYVRSLGQFDIVYSWGVLHHTGDQWTAIRNASYPVGEGGLFYIALYSADVQINPTAEEWLEIKQRYVRSSKLGRARLVWWYIWNFSMGRNPLKLSDVIKTAYEYRFKRGMSYLTDIRDWVGGWPMEFSHDADVLKFADEELGFDLVRIAQGEANTEYLLRRRAAGARSG